ncbi:hypothetical protein [Xanthomonas euvesicatoria]|uniref:hypothetical protein n=1 Tax=Xanthomonas euvesicatoria TaxID=456327 RepID=UPI003A100CE7
MIRAAAATVLTLVGLVVFCAGLLGKKEHSNDIPGSGTHVVVPQHGESHDWGGGVHEAYGAAAGEPATTMKCSAFQGGAQ